MRKVVLAAGLAAMVASPALAQSMNAQAFYRRATALKAKGMMAIFSKSEIDVLLKEGEASGKAARARAAAEVAAGHGRACLPAARQKMGSDEFIERLGRIPAAERARIDLTEATVRMLAVKYPCPRG